ncbi:MAG: TolC family protein [Bacteroides sp.]|nr:TolC family protein [Prevotella sp.]MCM1407246.1 TolC family protein [Treponema brennaborense]MCM1469734.1 TolC family protein [Bacteroides sp.]
MKSKTMYLIMLFANVLCFAASENQEKSDFYLSEISFMQVLQHGIENNIDIRNQKMNVDAAAGALRNAVAETGVHLGTSVQYSDTTDPFDKADPSVQELLVSDKTITAEYIKSTGLETEIWLEKISKYGMENKISLSLNKSGERYSFSNNKIANNNSDIKNQYMKDDSNTATLAWTMKIPLFKSFSNAQTKNAILQAELALNQQNSSLNNIIIETVIGITNAYWDFVSAYLSYKNDIDSTQRLQDQVDRIKVLSITGAAAKTEILQLTAHIASKKTDITLGKDTLIAAIAELEKKAGYTPGTITEQTIICDTFPDISFAKIPPFDDIRKDNHFIEKAISNRPDTKISEITLKIAEKEYEAKKISTLPDFDFVSSLGYTGKTYGNGLSKLFESTKENIYNMNASAGISFKMNLAGNTKASISEAKAAYEQKVSEYNYHIEDAKQSIKLSYSKLYSMQDAVNNSYDVVRMYGDLQIGTQKQFEAGLVTADTLNDSEDKYVSAKKQYYSCFKSYLESILTLKKNTGTFFSVPFKDGNASMQNIYTITNLNTF